ncbi:uncharacterized protein HD556DRAFT_1303885 [Suillus plorans]|uniref:Uncharacterized protein n=1 Tax=Suillus plorans TaxID=116603 RepID=A0A9P7DVH6_9AGAM|nr:uncharacterized protein HD556DRAFT_1303885 [Suillus plorans]KAG1803900.1 hypothetical protein HD556DRAFT_1303885 [Suillus plorans]
MSRRSQSVGADLHFHIELGSVPELNGVLALGVELTLTDEQQALLRPFSAGAYPSYLTQLYHKLFSVAIIKFPDLDLAARTRHRRWLQPFGQDDLVATISNSMHAPIPTLRDTKTWTFLREIEKISWYELDVNLMSDTGCLDVAGKSENTVMNYVREQKDMLVHALDASHRRNWVLHRGHRDLGRVSLPA